jgi:hypothetical protein
MSDKNITLRELRVKGQSKNSSLINTLETAFIGVVVAMQFNSMGAMNKKSQLH